LLGNIYILLEPIICMKILKQCIIENCPNEAKIIAKCGGRSYYSCDIHKKEVIQIIAAENKVDEINKLESLELKIPKWMKL